MKTQTRNGRGGRWNRAPGAWVLLVVFTWLSPGCGGRPISSGTDGTVDRDGARDGEAADDGTAPDDGAPPGDGTAADAGRTDGTVNPDGGGGTCTDNNDCLSTHFCEKAGCNTQSGTCEPRPQNCSDQANVVCGCDGINYWNDCLRRQHGVVANHNGRCTMQERVDCGGLGNTPCPGSAHCAYLFPTSGRCGMMDPYGDCWIIPPSCPPIATGAEWRPCFGGPVDPCLSMCDAIRDGGWFYHDTNCP